MKISSSIHFPANDVILFLIMVDIIWNCYTNNMPCFFHHLFLLPSTSRNIHMQTYLPSALNSVSHGTFEGNCYHYKWYKKGLHQVWMKSKL
jgi:hypothetical protein